MQLSLSRVASAAWAAVGWNGSGGKIALCRSCAKTLRRSLAVQVGIFIIKWLKIPYDWHAYDGKHKLDRESMKCYISGVLAILLVGQWLICA